MPRRRRDGHAHSAQEQPGDGSSESKVHSGNRRNRVPGRGPQHRRDNCLRLHGLPRPLRVLPASRRHDDGQADPRERRRDQGNRTPEPALRRAAQAQPRVGCRGSAARHEPLHGTAHLLFLRRRHRHLRGHRSVHRHGRTDERRQHREWKHIADTVDACIRAIDAGAPERAAMRYAAMVTSLKARWLQTRAPQPQENHR